MLDYLILLLDIRVILVFLLVFFVTLAYIKACRPAAFPPGPPTLPFIGNVNLVASNNHLHRTFCELGKKYGPMFSLQLGWYPAVVINDYDLLKEALLKKGNQCSDRPIHLFIMKFIPTASLGIIGAEGQIWKESRKLAVSSLRDFGVGKASIEHKVLEEADCMLSEIAAKQGKTFSFDLLFKKASSNVICAMLFGKRYSYDNAEFIDILRTLETFMDIGNMFTQASVLIPYLLPYLFLKQGSSLKLMDKIIAVIKRNIEEHKQDFDPENIRDFIDVFLENAAQDKTNIVFSDLSCIEIINNLFIAGTDTTSGSLSWAMLFMLHHPHIQHKCRQEILQVIGKDRKPCLKDRLEMPFVEATLFETLRIATIAPHAVSHVTAGEVNLNGYTLHDDTIIIPDIYSIHMNPKVWEEPEEFRPQRFIGDDGNVTKPPHFLPFSIGRRACLGEHLARTELFLFFTTLLQNFVFTCEETEKLPTIDDGSMGLTFLPAPYQVIARPV